MIWAARPGRAAASSFAVFLLGALIPALPVFLVAPQHIVSASMIAASSGLFLLGALITVFTGRHPLLSGLRQLLIGLPAASVTFGIGRLFGVMTGA
uniref:VIT1/CCC1 transporter family protein n=1 Tax=Paludibacterium denitrificans TaxID=2675226 RepID=UPI0035E45FCA